MLKAHTPDNGRAVGERLWPRADVDVPLPWRTRWAVYELAVDDVRDARDGGPATFDCFDRGDEQRALREAHWQLVLGAALYKRTAIWLECVPAAEGRGVAYRFWLALDEPALREAIAARRKCAAEAWAKRVDGERLHTDSAVRRRHQAAAGASATSDVLRLADALGDDERWALLHSDAVYARAARAGMTRFVAGDVAPERGWRVRAVSLAELRARYTPDFQQRVVERLLAPDAFDAAPLVAREFGVEAHVSTDDDGAAWPAAASATERAARAEWWAGRASLTPAARAMAAYWRRERASTMINYAPHRAAHSALAEIVVGLMDEYERVHGLHATHGDALLLELALGDAYRRAHALHLNVLLAGAPDAGKSYVLECVTRTRAVPGSVLHCSRATAAAYSVAGDYSDVVTVYDEYPVELLRAARGAASGSRIDREKQRLSQGRVTTLTIERREQRVVESTHSGVTLAACNVLPREMDAAMRSRFLLLRAPALFARRAALVPAPRAPVAEVDAAVRRARWLQWLHYVAEQLLRVGALRPISTPATGVCAEALARCLSDELAVVVPHRAMLRTRLVARQLVLRRALLHARLDPRTAVPHRALLSLDAALTDDEELAHFALELMHADLLDADAAERVHALGCARRRALDLACIPAYDLRYGLESLERAPHDKWARGSADYAMAVRGYASTGHGLVGLSRVAPQVSFRAR